MESSNNYLAGEDLLSSARRDVEISGGRRVLVRRLKRASLALAIGGIPDVSSLAVGGGENPAAPAMTDRQIEQAVKAIDTILIEGVMKPKLYRDPERGPTPDDFSDEDRYMIYRAIMDLSGWTRAKAEEVLPLSETSA